MKGVYVGPDFHEGKIKLEFDSCLLCPYHSINENIAHRKVDVGCKILGLSYHAEGVIGIMKDCPLEEKE